MNKEILDMCCGGRMFYFDKADPRVLFCDIRRVKTELCDGRDFEVAPDVQCDFTNLPFPGESFSQVIFDPPHLMYTGKDAHAEPTGYQQIKYGALYTDWPDKIRKGFAEAFRVLKPHGTLVFKWNETDVKVREILALTPHKPVIGHKSGKASKTHWILFYKGGVE